MTPINSTEARCGEPINLPLSSTQSANAASNQSQSTLFKKMKNIAILILNFGIGLRFYISNPLIFAGCVIVGIAWKDPVFSGVKRINDVWRTRSFNAFSIGCFGSVLVAGGAFLSLPAMYLAGSMFYAAYWGAKMSEKAQKMLAKGLCKNSLDVSTASKPRG